MSLPKTLTETYLFETARLVKSGKINLEEGSAQLIAISAWGNPSDGEMNQIDTLLQELIQDQQEPHFANILAELNLAVCKVVGSPSQEVICANTVGEAITALKDPRLTPRRIEVYKSALEIAVNSDDQWRAAILNNNLGNAYSELTTGDPQENIKAAIDCFEQALAIFTPEAVPYAWASIQNNLATVYKVKPGDDGQNIRPAIVCWEKAMSIFQKAVYPLEWANVQRNLGIAYKDLNTGDPVENLNRARDYLLSTLEIFTPDQHPVLWAEVQNTLGNVFFRLTTGNTSENLKRAIACFEAALAIRTLETYPAQFAATMVNLGNVWLSLSTGDRAENLYKAIDYYEAALAVYSSQDFPELYAQTQTNLAAAYLHMPSGDRAQNLQKAEQSLRIALGVFTQSRSAMQYAWCKSTQGAVYQEMARNNDSYSPQSIASYQAALEVYTEESFPADFARVVDALGTLYRSSPEGDLLENRRKAEKYYEAALRTYRLDTYPDNWASTQTDLGNCYLLWPTADRSETLPKAIKCYQSALSVHTREHFPLDYARLMDGLATAYGLLSDQSVEIQASAVQCLQEAWEAATEVGASNEVGRIAGNGGSLFWRRGDWVSAYKWLARAINTLEGMWGEHYSSIGRQELQQEHSALYARMILSCHELCLEKDAINYIEHSRSRYLLSLLGSTLKHLPDVPQLASDQIGQLWILSEDLHSLDSVITLSESAEQALLFLRRQESIRQEQRSILKTLEKKLPEYVALWKGQPQELQSLREILKIV